MSVLRLSLSRAFAIGTVLLQAGTAVAQSHDDDWDCAAGRHAPTALARIELIKL
jgi:hypothetical protein